MFEFIGICVVIYFCWRIIKSILSAAMRKTLSKAISFSTEQGVPRNFAIAVTENPNALSQARKIAKEINPNIAALDAYHQYGLAIVMLHERSQENESKANLVEITAAVQLFLQPQIDRLEDQGLRTHINDVVLAYMLVLATALTKHAGKKSVNFSELKEMAKNIFRSKDNANLIENAFELINSNPSDFLTKCNALTPLIMEELNNNKGEYYERYTKKALLEIEEMFNCSLDYDPRTAKKHNFLDV